MSALGILNQSNTAGYTSSASTSWQNVGSGLTLGASGKKYAILVTAQVSADNPDQEHGFQVTIDGTAIPRSVTAWEAAAADRYASWSFVHEYTTTNANEVVRFQFNGTTAPQLAKVNTVEITALPLDGLSANDYKFAEDDDTGSPVALGNADQATFASVTFTPENNNDDWLVIGNATIGIDSSTTNYRVGIKESVGSTTAPYMSQEGEDGSPSEVEKRIALVSRVFTLSNASHTISVWADNDSTAANFHRGSAIFCLRLNAFKKYVNGYTDTAYSYSAANTWEQVDTTSITPDVTGAFFGVVTAMHDASTSAFAHFRLQIDNTTVYPTNFDAEECGTRYDSTDEGCMVITPYISSLTASTAYTLDIDAKSTSSSSDVIRRGYCFFSDELASSGVTGTMTATMSAPIGDMTGTFTPLPVTGSLVATMSPLTGSMTGTFTPLPVTGTLEATMSPLTGSMTGTFTPLGSVTGTLEATMTPFTGAMTGTATVPSFTGTLEAAMTPFTGAFTGTFTPLPVTGTLEAIFTPLSGDMTGTFTPLAVTGTLVGVMSPFTGAFTGTVTSPTTTGTLEATFTPLTGAMTGTFTPLPVTGTLEATFTPFSSSMAGTFIPDGGYTGTLVATFTQLTSSMSGTAGPQRIRRWVSRK